MTQRPGALGRRSRENAREKDDGQVERIRHAQEPSGLLDRGRVDRARSGRRIVGDDSHRPAAKTSERGD